MTKGFAVFALIAALFAGCGGRSSGNGGGAGLSGAGNVAGSSSIGGGAGSAGATPSSPCALPKVVGPCDAYVPSFWHDPETGLCVPFVYGGCAGNDNRFETREACLTQCPSSESPAGDCQNDSDCTLTNASCCPTCEPVSDSEFVALNVSFLTPIHARLCPIEPPCDPVLCLGATEYDATGKYFKPVCRSGHCTSLDVRQSDLTACTADADCILRDGVGCCQECDGAGIVAVNARADLCGGRPQPCPACASRLPPDLKAACTNEHCALALPTR